jgi:hypothetical protein
MWESTFATGAKDAVEECRQIYFVRRELNTVPLINYFDLSGWVSTGTNVTQDSKVVA